MIDAEASLLAGEIHDELIPLLFASAANVNQVIRELDGQIDQSHLERLRNIADWLDQGMSIGRQLVGGAISPDFQSHSWHDLAKARLDQLHSCPSDAIRWSVNQNAAEIGCEVAFAAMRITVEACRNAVLHGHATQINVDATATEGKLTLTIEDDGTGFDPNQVPKGHFGLRVMESRAAQVGGRLSIESKQGEGTKIEFTTR